MTSSDDPKEKILSLVEEIMALREQASRELASKQQRLLQKLDETSSDPMQADIDAHELKMQARFAKKQKAD